jgi:bacteriocin-like protein
MKELNTKELISINGGGPIFKWFGRVMAAIDNYVLEKGNEYLTEVEAGNYVAD